MDSGQLSIRKWNLGSDISRLRFVAMYKILNEVLKVIKIMKIES